MDVEFRHKDSDHTCKNANVTDLKIRACDLVDCLEEDNKITYVFTDGSAVTIETGFRGSAELVAV